MMATSSREDPLDTFDFDDLLQQSSNELHSSNKETKSTSNPPKNDPKLPPCDLHVCYLQKDNENPEQNQTFASGHNGASVRDKVSGHEKIDLNGIQDVDQVTDSNNKSGDDDDNHEIDGYVEFKDCVGRKFKFPYKGIKKWKVMFSNTLISNRLTIVLAYESYNR